MTSWSAPVTRHLLEHRFWVDLNANSVFSSDGIITSKYSSFVPWAEMELDLWANCAKIKKCNQEKKIGNLLNFTSMQWFTTTIPFVILLCRTGLIIKVKVVPFNTAAILSFLSVCSHWFAQTTFFCSWQKNCILLFCHSLTFLIVKKERIFVKNKLTSCYWWRRI